MQTYCVSCKKTRNKNPKVIKTKNGRLQMKSNCSFPKMNDLVFYHLYE